ncbi:hypothetical protein ACPOL_5012 [Acidisarcina polymorpha]|uniref:DUF3037 domain-containing protein n=1 Tax=Acidisarcina polymorpha TaxID=2211140 RepID=A0A2Z5G527_9BACT|nr:DUF3037 domain-containing protein [Acidisarcina polymorpha]AXC14272.1 hypothetical protein ACPOL_5012 [Acidisarcina polymorpha]
MPARNSFDYAVLRVVPRVERGEFINAGVVAFCLEQRFLEARIVIDEARLLALWPDIDLDAVRRHLEAIPKICAADSTAGPIAQLSQRERFHWIVSPRSTIIQVSPVHTGICDHPAESLEHLSRLFLGTESIEAAPARVEMIDAQP